MAGFQITVTDAGRQEIINAENDGTTPVLISEIGVGNGAYNPDPTQTALQNEIKRLNTVSGDVVADDTIHVSVEDSGSDTYEVWEFGLFTDSGTLFAVYSQTSNAILDKTAQTILLLATDIILTTVDATSLTFGNTDFMNPYATDQTPGVVELATPTETQDGTDGTLAVTPAGLNSRTATQTRTGLIETATNAEAQAKNNGSAALTPANLPALSASTTFEGLIELATDTEAQNKSSGARALTPANLAALGGTEALAGLLALANNTEALAGADDTKAMTAALVHAAFNQYGLGITLPDNPTDDANDTSSTQFYRLRSSASNVPADAGDNMLLMNFEHNTSFVQILSQFVGGAANAGFWLRTSYQGNFTNWQKFLTDINYASQTQAENGSSDKAVMTPLRVHQAFGLYGLGLTSATPVSDFNALSGTGLYGWDGNTSNGPPRVGVTIFGLVLHQDYDSNNAQQMAYTQDAANPKIFFRIKNAGTWQAWEELLHRGNTGDSVTEDVQTISGMDYRTALSGGGITMTARRQYHIVDNNTYTLPDTTSLTPGDSVVISKSVYAAPVIDTFGTEEIVTDDGNNASVTLDADLESVFIWNNTNWEKVAGNAAAGFSQSLTDNGYQKLPSGLIIQWGATSVGTSALPIAFPNQAFQSVVSDNYDGTAHAAGSRITLSSIEIESDETGAFRYVAIGN